MKNIRFHIFNILLASVLLMAGGCIMDHYDDPEYTAPETATLGYMSVKLMTDDGSTRAQFPDSFDQGTNSEYQLSDEAGHYAVFYTEGNDLPIAVASLGAMTSEIYPDAQANTSVVFATIAARDEQKAALELLHNCYIILNSDISEGDFWEKKSDELLELVSHSPFFMDSNGRRYFKMVNAVYVENGKSKIHTEVDTSKIYGSYQEAMEQAWKGNAAVNAYVERLAAKFSLSFENEDYNRPDADRIFTPENNSMIVFSHMNNADIPYYEDGKGNVKYQYKVRITGWGLNALEQENWLFRKFNPAGGYFTGWYSTDNKRVFWSEDCNYKKATYPWQYRKVIDNSGIAVYSNGGAILKNLSFEELQEGGFVEKYKYSPENTFDFADASFSKALDSRPELLAGTHVIVCAELLTNLDNTGVFEAREIYRDRNGNFYRSEKDVFKALVSSMNNSLQTHSYLKFTYWDWSRGGVEMKLFARTKGDFALYYNDMKLTPENIDRLFQMYPNMKFTADAEFKGGDGKRIIWLEGMNIRDSQGNMMQTFENIDEVDSKNDIWLRESNINDVKSVIFEHVGAVDHFQDGKMYYAVPVGLVKDDKNSSTNNDVFSIYGVVRNCSYNMSIQGVKGIGASVDDVTQPIIPNTVKTHDHLYISFDILDWHLTENTVPGLIN